MKKIFLAATLLAISLTACASPGESGWQFVAPERCSWSSEVHTRGAGAPQVMNQAHSGGFGLVSLARWLLESKQAPIEKLEVEMYQKDVVSTEDTGNGKIINKLGSGNVGTYRVEVTACENRLKEGARARREIRRTTR